MPTRLAGISVRASEHSYTGSRLEQWKQLVLEAKGTPFISKGCPHPSHESLSLYLLGYGGRNFY